jgi:low affinity Fe/Cu permease
MVDAQRITRDIDLTLLVRAKPADMAKILLEQMHKAPAVRTAGLINEVLHDYLRDQLVDAFGCTPADAVTITAGMDLTQLVRTTLADTPKLLLQQLQKIEPSSLPTSALSAIIKPLLHRFLNDQLVDTVGVSMAEATILTATLDLTLLIRAKPADVPALLLQQMRNAPSIIQPALQRLATNRLVGAFGLTLTNAKTIATAVELTQLIRVKPAALPKLLLAQMDDEAMSLVVGPMLHRMLHEQLLDMFGLTMKEAKTITSNIDLTQLVRVKPADMPQLLLQQSQRTGAEAVVDIIKSTLRGALDDQLVDRFGITPTDATKFTSNIDLTQLVRTKPADLPKLLLSQAQGASAAAISTVAEPMLQHMLNEQLVDVFGMTMPNAQNITSSIDLTQLVRAQPADIPKLLLSQMGGTATVKLMLHRIMDEQLVDQFGMSLPEARNITDNIDLTQLVRAKPADVPKLLLAQMELMDKDAVSLVVDPVLRRLLNEHLVDVFGMTMPDAKKITANSASHLAQLVRAKPAGIPKLLLSHTQGGADDGVSTVVGPMLHRMVTEQLVDAFGLSMPEASNITRSVDLTQLVRAKPTDIPKLLLRQIQTARGMTVLDTVISPTLHRMLNEQLVDTFGLSMPDASNVTHRVDLTQLVRAKPADMPNLLLAQMKDADTDLVFVRILDTMLRQLVHEQLVDVFGLALEEAKTVTSSVDLTQIVRATPADLPKLLLAEIDGEGKEEVSLVVEQMLERMLHEQLVDVCGLSMMNARQITATVDRTQLVRTKPTHMPRLLLSQLQKSAASDIDAVVNPMLKRMMNEQLVDIFGVSMADARTIVDSMDLSQLVRAKLADMPKLLVQMGDAGDGVSRVQLVDAFVNPMLKRMIHEQLVDTFGLSMPQAKTITSNVDLIQLVRAKPADIPKLLLAQTKAPLSTLVGSMLHRLLNEQLVDTFGLSTVNAKLITANGDLTQLVRAKPADIPKLLLLQMQSEGGHVVATVVTSILHRILNEQLVDAFGLSMPAARNVTKNIDLTQLVRAKPADMPMLLLAQMQGVGKEAVTTVVNPMLHRLLNEKLVDEFGLSMAAAATIASAVDLTQLVRAKPADMPKLLLSQTMKAGNGGVLFQVVDPMLRRMVHEQLVDLLGMSISTARTITDNIDLTGLVRGKPLDLPKLLLSHTQKVAGTSPDVAAALDVAVNSALQRILKQKLVDVFGISLAEANHITATIDLTQLVRVKPADMLKLLLQQTYDTSLTAIDAVIDPMMRRMLNEQLVDSFGLSMDDAKTITATIDLTQLVRAKPTDMLKLLLAQTKVVGDDLSLVVDPMLRRMVQEQLVDSFGLSMDDAKNITKNVDLTQLVRAKPTDMLKLLLAQMKGVSVIVDPMLRRMVQEQLVDAFGLTLTKAVAITDNVDLTQLVRAKPADMAKLLLSQMQKAGAAMVVPVIDPVLRRMVQEQLVDSFGMSMAGAKIITKNVDLTQLVRAKPADMPKLLLAQMKDAADDVVSLTVGPMLRLMVQEQLVDVFGLSMTEAKEITTSVDLTLLARTKPADTPKLLLQQMQKSAVALIDNVVNPMLHRLLTEQFVDSFGLPLQDARAITASVDLTQLVRAKPTDLPKLLLAQLDGGEQAAALIVTPMLHHMLDEQLVDRFGLRMDEARNITSNMDLTQLVRARQVDVPELLLAQIQRVGMSAMSLVVDPMLQRMLVAQLVDVFGLTYDDAKSITSSIDLTQLVRAKPEDVPKLLLQQSQAAALGAVRTIIDPTLKRMLDDQLVDTFGLTMPEARSITANIDLTQLVRAKPADVPKLLLAQMQKAAVAAIENVIDPMLNRMLSEQLVDVFGLSMADAKTITANLDLTQLVRAKPADVPKLLLAQMQKAALAAVDTVINPMLHRMLNEQLVDVFGVSMVDAKTITDTIDLTQLVRAKPADMPKLLLSQMQKAGAAAVELVLDPTLKRMLNEQLVDVFGLTMPEARSITANIDLTQLVRAKPADVPKLLLTQLQKIATGGAFELIVEPMLRRMLNEQLVDVFGVSMAGARTITDNVDLTQLVRAKPADVPKLLLTQMQKAAVAAVDIVINPTLHRMLNNMLVDKCGLSLDEAKSITSSIDLTQLVRAKPANMPKILLQQVQKAGATAATVVNPMLHRMLNAQLVDRFGLSMPNAKAITRSIDLTQLVRAKPVDMPKLLLTQMQKAGATAVEKVVNPMLHRMLNEQLVDVFGLTFDEAKGITSSIDLTQLVRAKPADIPKLLLKQLKTAALTAVDTVINPMLKRMLNEQLVDSFGISMVDAKSITRSIDLAQLVRAQPGDMPKILMQQATAAGVELINTVIDPMLQRMLNDQLVVSFGLSMPEAISVTSNLDLKQLVQAQPADIPKLLLKQVQAAAKAAVPTIIDPMMKRMLNEQLVDTFGVSMKDAKSVTDLFSITELVNTPIADVPKVLLRQMTGAFKEVMSKVIDPAVHQLMIEQLVDWFGVSLQDAQTVVKPVNLTMLVNTPLSQMPKVLIQQASKLGVQFVQKVLTPAVQRVLDAELMDRLGLTNEESKKITDPLADGLLTLATASPEELPALMMKMGKDIGVASLEVLTPAVKQMIDDQLIDNLGLSLSEARNVTEPLDLTVLVTAAPADIPKALLDQAKAVGEQLVQIVVLPTVKRVATEVLIDRFGMTYNDTVELFELIKFENLVTTPVAQMPAVLWKEVQGLASKEKRTRLVQIVMPVMQSMLSGMLISKFGVSETDANYICTALGDTVIKLVSASPAEIPGILLQEIKARGGELLKILQPILRRVLAQKLIDFVGITPAQADQIVAKVDMQPFIDAFDNPASLPMVLFEQMRSLVIELADVVQPAARLVIQLQLEERFDLQTTVAVKIADAVDIVALLKATPDTFATVFLDQLQAVASVILGELLEPAAKGALSKLTMPLICPSELQHKVNWLDLANNQLEAEKRASEIAANPLADEPAPLPMITEGQPECEMDAVRLSDLMPSVAPLITIAREDITKLPMALWKAMQPMLEKAADLIERCAQVSIVCLCLLAFSLLPPVSLTCPVLMLLPCLCSGGSGEKNGERIQCRRRRCNGGCKICCA